MTIKNILKGLGIVAVSAFVAYIVAYPSTKPYVGGSFNSTTIDFAQGLSLNGTSFVDGSGNINAFGTTNVIGNSAKTSYNKLTGYTKIDDRPTGGATTDYALQIRSESAKTSGTHWGIDGETHLKASGTATLRGNQGVAVLDTGYTSTAGSLIGTYGQARADGTFNAGGGFITGLYGLVEASAAITASHVSSLWLDSHQNNTVTGSHQLLYMTNNGSATMDEAIYIYGGNKITNLFQLNTVSGMVSNTATTAGASKKILISIDGSPYYINAYAGE
jgi:hypothetical protein